MPQVGGCTDRSYAAEPLARGVGQPPATCDAPANDEPHQAACGDYSLAACDAGVAGCS